MSLRRLIKDSPVGPFAVALYRKLKTRTAAEVKNAIYDAQTLEVMRRLLAVDSCCVDVGAHEGDILREIVRLSPQGGHYAIEPLPHLARRLKVKFPEVTVIEAAAGERPGTSSFVYVENDPGYSGLRERRYDRPDRVLKPITVNVVTLDDVIERPVRLVKIDVEGGEYHAMRGGLRVIHQFKPVIIFEAGKGGTVNYGVNASDFVSLMDGLSYRLSTMKRWLAGEPPYGRGEFEANWESGPDYYFIAYP